MIKRPFLLLGSLALVICPPLAVTAQTCDITIQAAQPGAVISSNLVGIFFEEISMAGDGGLYAELIRNRSFEDASTPAPWALVTNGVASGSFALDSSLPLSPTNAQCLRLSKTAGSGSIGAANNGYYGIPVTSGQNYNLGFYARALPGFSGTVTASLQSSNGTTTYAQSAIGGLNTSWQHFALTLVPTATDPSARLLMSISQAGSVFLDFVSLFPAQTFNQRTNGLRPDLANMLLNLRPSFVRFPGGSWVDGSSLANAYHWQLTVGDPANRVPRSNLWGYMVDNGLGYHEYLQMCEDIGATPLLDVNAGMDVGQNAVPVSQLGPWVQEAVNAIAYANDGIDTPWGALRAANGHPAPFNLQYIEIGNENGGSAYNANYGLFYDAIKSSYPAVHIIANSWGSIPSSRPVEIMDEHYYQSAAWFIQNANHYDSYSRNGPKVFVGEYATAFAIPPATFPATLWNAIGEAAWMTGLERNSDVVALASYAPLFCNLNNPSWYPDLIYFNGTQVYGTPSYYVQQMFSRNRGDVVLPLTVSAVSNLISVTPRGAIGLGSWNTSVQYSNVVVSSNGVTLYQSDFSSGAPGWQVYNGSWSTSAGLYQQTALITDCRSTTGNTGWSNYTLTVRARKVSGNEGFLILFNWLDDNNWTWWNIGGWNNTLHGIEQMVNGSKSLVGSQVSGSVNASQWYTIQIVLTGSRIQCYLDGQLIHDVNYPVTAAVVASASYSRPNNQIIVKAVNASAFPIATTFHLGGLDAIAPSATLIQLTSASASDENSLTWPTKVSPTTTPINNAGTNFSLSLPANSVSVLRLQASGLHTVTNLQLLVPSPLNVGQTVPAVLWGWSSGQAGPVNLATNSNHAITWTSADTTVAGVDSSGNVTAVSPGTTTVTATYASLGLAATQPVQVIGPPRALVHRYSFNDSPGSNIAVDSAGGPAWNGWLPNSGTFANGRLSLAAANQQYVQLPAGILSNYSAVTIETWVTFPNQLPVNCFFYGFGNTDASGAGYDYIFCAPQGGRIAITAADPGWQGEQNAVGAGDLSFLTNLHFVAVYNPPGGKLALYTNGVLVAQNTGVTIPMSAVSSVLNYIGRSLYNADPYPDLVLDEFRMYNWALRLDEIAATDVLGPNQLLSTNSPALTCSMGVGALTLSWSLASPGFALVSRTNLATGPWVTVPATPQILGTEWQVSVPISGTSEFYRLQSGSTSAP